MIMVNISKVVGSWYDYQLNPVVPCAHLYGIAISLNFVTSYSIQIIEFLKIRIILNIKLKIRGLKYKFPNIFYSFCQQMEKYMPSQLKN
jgi:hypothetical protein